jgi:hypothetical protein
MTPDKPGNRSNRWKIFSPEATRFSGRVLLKDAEPELYAEMYAELEGLIAYIDARAEAFADRHVNDWRGIPARHLPEPPKRVTVEPARAPRPSYSAMWDERRRAREGGTPSAWRLDALAKAAMYERRAKETEALVVAVKDHATPYFLERLARAAEQEWKKADDFYATYVASTRVVA